ncbi:17455_t:CDS:2 [Racocetra fulgida]|uniref:17455_t:CDS:1 n=1 Tax=Racocetra fulgida TaxID=60492 RepID=A0A9N8W2P0_9GLOM|nr:17455_t:CDS:2 [Racocetra fulgida]
MLSLSNLKIKEITSENNPHSSSFVFQYFPPTLELTIGNFLRRILLTLLSGVATFAIEIRVKDKSVTTDDQMVPVLTKFSTLVGVGILAEIKEKKDEIYCLEMDVNNPEDKECIVTANDFQSDPHLVIKNPDLYLATLAPFSRLQIKLYFREDFGYYTAEKQEKHLPQAKNVIFFDTNYSPIEDDGVNFQVNSVATGLEKEEKELKLTIDTNGTISPRQALLQALEISNYINDKIRNKLVKS